MKLSGSLVKCVNQWPCGVKLSRFRRGVQERCRWPGDSSDTGDDASYNRSSTSSSSFISSSNGRTDPLARTMLRMVS